MFHIFLERKNKLSIKVIAHVYYEMFGNLSAMIYINSKNVYQCTKFIIDLASFALKVHQIPAFNFKMYKIFSQ